MQAAGKMSQDETTTPAKERESGIGHGSGDRNEDQYLDDTAAGSEEPRGRAANGESYEDEADNALFRRPKQQASVKSYDGGDLGPGGEVLPGGADPSRHPEP